MSPAGSAASPAHRAAEAFARAFGEAPQAFVQAPGRVNLIGEHTDYNDGFVLPCAIDFHTAIALTPRSGRRLSVCAADFANAVVEIDLDAPLKCDPAVGWADYVRAMVWAWLDSGRPLGGAALAIAGNVPQGAGLSSSASLEVALTEAFGVLSGFSEQSPARATEMALLAQKAENEFVGCHCGIMDQLISAHGAEGHAQLIDCRTLSLTPVPIPSNLAVLIIDSKVQRGLVGSEYNQRRQQCEAVAQHFGVPALRDLDGAALDACAAELDPVALRRARHVVTENARTLAAAEALARGDGVRLGELMAQSHASMRDDFEITVPPIDQLVELVQSVLGPVGRAAGGVRMTGGGFGGCVVGLVPLDKVEAVREAVARQYRSPQGLPAPVYVCQPSAGAGPLLSVPAGG